MTGRPTGELIVLILSATVCAVVLFATIGVLILEIIDPANDTAQASSVLGGILNTLLGLVAGYLAGRTGSRRE